MISSRWIVAAALTVTIMPLFGEPANAEMSRSTSAGSRGSIGLSSTPNGDAAAWNDRPLSDTSGGVRVAEHGAACHVRLDLPSSSSHFPLKLYSNWVNPVALRPGRARLATMPAPTGSIAWAKTIGTVRLARCSAWYVAPTPAKTTSEPSATSSSAYGRSRARSPAAQRYSIPRVAAHRPARLLQPLQERSEADL